MMLEPVSENNTLRARDNTVHIGLSWDNGPIMLDGGCSNILAIYDVKAEKFTQLKCDGLRIQLLQ